MAKHMIPFATSEDGDKELIELAFSKKKADERKEWLRQFKVRFYCDVIYIWLVERFEARHILRS